MLKWVETNFVGINPGISQYQVDCLQKTYIIAIIWPFAHPANTLHLSFPKLLRIQRGRLQGRIEFNHDKHTKTIIQNKGIWHPKIGIKVEPR